jgi:hypothetical protein
LSKSIRGPVIDTGSTTGTIGESCPNAVGYCHDSNARPRPNFSVADLPSPNTKRWVIARKAAVVLAVQNGVLSVEEACGRYSLSIEEYLCWCRLIERHGVAGLRVTRLKDYRKPMQVDRLASWPTKAERLLPVEAAIPKSE